MNKPKNYIEKTKHKTTIRATYSHTNISRLIKVKGDVGRVVQNSSQHDA